jgi:hypothetical protein
MRIHNPGQNFLFSGTILGLSEQEGGAGCCLPKAPSVRGQDRAKVVGRYSGNFLLMHPEAAAASSISDPDPHWTQEV